MNNKELPEAIFDLLASKSYEELSTNEQSLVLQHLSREEFQEMQSAIQGFQLLDQSVSVPFTPFKSPKKKVHFWKQIIYFPIPAYAAASILLLVSASFLFFCGSSKVEKEENGKSIQVKHKGKSIEEEDYPEDLIFTL